MKPFAFNDSRFYQHWIKDIHSEKCRFYRNTNELGQLTDNKAFFEILYKFRSKSHGTQLYFFVSFNNDLFIALFRIYKTH